MDLRERLAAIEAPTLVVAGSDDPSTPPERLRELAAAVRGAKYDELEGARHIANMALPDAFARAVLQHLTS
jgi:pimeloyl-ACP methyl ester carboxylesterase